jgi:hypothetical protein
LLRLKGDGGHASSRSGGALMLSGLLLTVAIAIISAANFRSRAAVRQVAQLTSRIEANYMAESALIIGIRRVGAGDRSGQRRTLGSGIATCWINDDPEVPDRPEVLAWGKSGSVERVLSVRTWIQAGFGKYPSLVHVYDMKELPAHALTLPHLTRGPIDVKVLFEKVHAVRKTLPKDPPSTPLVMIP